MKASELVDLMSEASYLEIKGLEETIGGILALQIRKSKLAQRKQAEKDGLELGGFEEINSAFEMEEDITSAEREKIMEQLSDLRKIEMLQASFD